MTVPARLDPVVASLTEHVETLEKERLEPVVATLTDHVETLEIGRGFLPIPQ